MRDTVWVTREGEKILVSQMETRHIKNCIAMILRHRCWRREYLDRLQLELLIRDMKLRG
jgi:hypothetical protein